MALRKRTDSYWLKRANQRLTRSERISKAHMRELAKVYNEARRQTVESLKQICAAYYKGQDGFDMQALRSIVPSGELKRFLDDMKKLGISTDLPDNYNARITRLRFINEQLAAQAHKVAMSERTIDSRALREVYTDSYYRAGYDVARGIGSTPSGFSTLDQRTVDKVMNARFEGRNFSTRVWKNSDILANKLKGELATAIATGQSIQKTAARFRDDFNVNQYYAERLIRTETNHFHNSAELEAYKEMGFEKFKFLATLDNRTSEICQEMDGKIFDVKNGLPGENIPPLHPNCRSTIVPYFKGYEPETRLYRDPETGKNKYTYNISYKEWRKDHEEALSPTGKRTVWEFCDVRRGKAESGIRKNDYETLLVIDEHGMVVHAEKGSQHQVRASDKALRLLAKDGYAMSHNHPSCSSFSAADLRMASTLNLRYIRAVSKYRTFELRPNGDWPSAELMAKVHSRNLRSAHKKANAWRVKTGNEPTPEMWGEYTHASMKKTASELNLIYKSDIIRKRK